MKPKRSTPVEGGFPLAAVVLLVTTVAALLACIDMPRVRRELAAVGPSLELAAGALVAVVAGGGLGSVLGLMRRRRVGGFFLGGAIGGLAALLLVPLALMPASLWQCLAGMSLMLVTSIAVRWNAR